MMMTMTMTLTMTMTMRMRMTMTICSVHNFIVTGGVLFSLPPTFNLSCNVMIASHLQPFLAHLLVQMEFLF